MPSHTHSRTSRAAMPIMTREELIQKVEELEGWLAEFNKVHVNAPQEFRSNVDRAFLEMADKLDRYRRALRDLSHQQGHPPGENDAPGGEDGVPVHRGPRSPVAISIPGNRSEHYLLAIKSTEY